MIKNQSDKTQDMKNKVSLVKSISAFIIKVALLFFFVIVIFNYVLGIVKVKDQGMSPSIKPADLVFIDRLNKKYVAKDLVSIKYEDELIISRVVAIGGDTVDINSEGLLVNGVLQQTMYEQETLLYEGGFKGPVTLKENEIFVLGDNRTNSIDSRVFGPIEINKTIGNVMFFLRRRNF